MIFHGCILGNIALDWPCMKYYMDCVMCHLYFMRVDFWRFEIFGFLTLEMYTCKCGPPLALIGSHKDCISIYVDSVKKFANINRTNIPHVLMWVMISLGPLRKLDYMHAIWLKKLIIYLIYFSIKQNYKFQVWHIPDLNLSIWYHEI